MVEVPMPTLPPNNAVPVVVISSGASTREVPTIPVRLWRITEKLLLASFPANHELVMELAVWRNRTALYPPDDGFISIPSFQLPPWGFMLIIAPVLVAILLLMPIVPS